MAALIVVGQNSYVSEAELTTYASDRGITLTEDESVLLIKAMDYLESLQWQGQKTDENQLLEWPRKYVRNKYYACGCSYIDDEIVPENIQKAQMALAVQLDAGNDPLATSEQQVQSETVGPLSVTYKNSSSNVPVLKSVNVLINKYLYNGSSGANQLRVSKA